MEARIYCFQLKPILICSQTITSIPSTVLTVGRSSSILEEIIFTSALVVSGQDTLK